MGKTNLDELVLKDGLEDDSGTQVIDASGNFTGNLSGNVTGLVNGAGLYKIAETVAFDDFTDGGAAIGTYALATKVPAGATFLYAAVTAVTGFAGDTSAVLTIGDGTDVDRYNTGTLDVFSNASTGVAAGAPSGVVYHAAEKTPTLTVTTASDFTSVTAGSVSVELYYLT